MAVLGILVYLLLADDAFCVPIRSPTWKSISSDQLETKPYESRGRVSTASEADEEVALTTRSLIRVKEFNFSKHNQKAQ